VSVRLRRWVPESAYAGPSRGVGSVSGLLTLLAAWGMAYALAGVVVLAVVERVHGRRER
jgi:hypothetical protein